MSVSSKIFKKQIGFKVGVALAILWVACIIVAFVRGY